MSDSFHKRLETKLTALEKLGLRRILPNRSGPIGRTIRTEQQSLLNFSSNDYLGLSTNEELKKVHVNAAEEYGVGSTGSRLICGNHPEYEKLEQELAEWKQTESALVFGSGYLTNIGVIRAVTGGRDWILYDELSHRCLIEGARLSQAKEESFAHNNLRGLKQKLESRSNQFDQVLVLVEGIYSMDGDRAPLESLRSCTDHYDAWLLVDEAHSAGVWGENGSGLSTALTSPPEIAMGTCSKAMGSYGGYVAGSESLRNFMINRATSFIYSTGLPPSVVSANRRAISLIREDSARRDQLKNNVSTIKREFAARGIPLPSPPSQIIPLVTGRAEQTLKAGKILRDQGIYAVPIRYPTVPRGQGRIRISLRSDHTEEDLANLMEAIDELDRRELLELTAPWKMESETER